MNCLILELMLLSKAHKYYHFLWWQFPIHSGIWVLLPEPTSIISCELYVESLHHSPTFWAVWPPIPTWMQGGWHLWWIVCGHRVDHMKGKVVWKGIFLRGKAIPRKRPSAQAQAWRPVNCVQFSDAMSRSEREACRRPYHLIMTLFNSLPVQ